MAETVVMLHGFTNTARSWGPVTAALGQSYSVLAPDIRGHGSAAAAEPVTLEAVLDDLAALHPGPYTLVGYSMGGRIALHAALALPARVARLVLIGSSPGLADAGARARRRREDERLASKLERCSIEEFARRWAQTPVLAGAPAAVRRAAHADRLQNTPAGLARALRGLGTGALPSLWERLGELRAPVLLLAGERDRKFREIAARMAAALPDARVLAVPGAGHAAHLEAPEAVAEAIRQP
jgi:2-succinyl-6-hydroxy-2,4-cyclohexadiene-1-carboxylate synthase